MADEREESLFDLPPDQPEILEIAPELREEFPAPPAAPAEETPEPPPAPELAEEAPKLPAEVPELPDEPLPTFEEPEALPEGPSSPVSPPPETSVAHFGPPPSALPQEAPEPEGYDPEADLAAKPMPEKEVSLETATRELAKDVLRPQAPVEELPELPSPEAPPSPPVPLPQALVPPPEIEPPPAEAPPLEEFLPESVDWTETADTEARTGPLRDKSYSEWAEAGRPRPPGAPPDDFEAEMGPSPEATVGQAPAEGGGEGGDLAAAIQEMTAGINQLVAAAEEGKSILEEIKDSLSESKSAQFG